MSSATRNTPVRASVAIAAARRGAHVRQWIRVPNIPRYLESLVCERVSTLEVAAMHGEMGQVLLHDRGPAPFSRLLAESKIVLVRTTGTGVLAVEPRDFAKYVERLRLTRPMLQQTKRRQTFFNQWRSDMRLGQERVAQLRKRPGCKEGFQPLRDLVRNLVGNGGKIWVCGACANLRLMFTSLLDQATLLTLHDSGTR